MKHTNVGPISNKEIKAFVGRNNEYYLEKWQSRENSMYKGWNFAAMFFSIEWMAYRKMYIEALVCFLVMWLMAVIVGFILEALDIRLNSNITRDAFRVFVGAIANALYHRKVMRAINKVSGVNETKRIDILKRDGGVSANGLIVCILIQVGIIIVMFNR